MYKATKNQGQSTYAGGLTKVVIGALALGLGELLGSGSATLFGSDQTSGMGELGPDLMGPPGDQVALHQGQAIFHRKRLI